MNYIVVIGTIFPLRDNFVFVIKNFQRKAAWVKYFIGSWKLFTPAITPE